jgi:hypothetical protein
MFKSAGNAHYRHTGKCQQFLSLAFLKKCRQCTILPALYRMALSLFSVISSKVPAMHSITGVF